MRQLRDGDDRHPSLGRRYDRDVEDIYAVQDELMLSEIVNILKRRFSLGEDQQGPE